MSQGKPGITFLALFGKAQTTPDGGWAITLNVGQDAALQVTQVAAVRNSLLQVALIPVSGIEVEGHELEGEKVDTLMREPL